MKTAFVFPGQGAQAVGMGKDLFEQYPAAANIFKKADDILGYSLSDICFNGPTEKLTETRYCQPAIYVMSAACLEVFKEKFSTIKPEASAGLSLGEFTALYAAGVFSFEDGLRIIEKRAIYMQEACDTTKGAMASIMKGELAVIQTACSEAGCDIANINSPGQIVISGEAGAVAKAIELIKERGVAKTVMLNVAGAYHSRLMKPAELKLAEYVKQHKLNKAQIPVAQNYVGTLISEPAEIENNIIKQVTGSVKWIDCINAVSAIGINNIIELGPGSVLTGLVKRINPNIMVTNINTVDSINNFKI